MDIIFFGNVLIMADNKTGKKRLTIAEFMRQVMTKSSKVVWPNRQQTVTTSIMVFVMMTLLALFFMGTDAVFNSIVTFLLTLA